MLKIEKTVTASPEQLEIGIEGMRNAMNSWPDMDSSIEYIENHETVNRAAWQFHLGEKDEKLMLTLNKGGTSESKYRRMIPVWLTFSAPLYWWKEFDTYKVGTVCNSCSTMHKITAKKFELDDFSCEQLAEWDGNQLDIIEFANYCFDSKNTLELTVKALNHYRDLYLKYDKLIKESKELNREAMENLVAGKRR